MIEFNMRTNAGKERPVSSGSIAVDAFVAGVLPPWLRHRRWGPRFVARYEPRHTTPLLHTSERLSWAILALTLTPIPTLT